MSIGDDVSRETAAVPPHWCTGPECPLHGSKGDAAVKIARIEADRDIEVARISRGEYERTTEVRAETDIAVAEIQAAAGVEETAALAEGIADSGAEAPEIALTDVAIPDAEPEVQATIEPRDDDADDGMPAAPKSSGWSYW
jgi:hypothetical protein